MRSNGQRLSYIYIHCAVSTGLIQPWGLAHSLDGDAPRWPPLLAHAREGPGLEGEAAEAEVSVIGEGGNRKVPPFAFAERNIRS